MIREGEGRGGKGGKGRKGRFNVHYTTQMHLLSPYPPSHPPTKNTTPGGAMHNAALEKYN